MVLKNGIDGRFTIYSSLVCPNSSNSAFLSIFANGDDNGRIITDALGNAIGTHTDGPELVDGGPRSTVSLRRCQCVTLKRSQPLPVVLIWKPTATIPNTIFNLAMWTVHSDTLNCFRSSVDHFMSWPNDPIVRRSRPIQILLWHFALFWSFEPHACNPASNLKRTLLSSSIYLDFWVKSNKA